MTEANAPRPPELPWSEGAWSWVECGEGWWSIIAELNEKLLEIVPDYQVTQVKEKFGGLRYYTSYPSENYLDVKDAVEPLIRDAEEKASRTCMECGKPGSLRTPRGWYVTLCDEDFAAREAWIAQAKKES